MVDTKLIDKLKVLAEKEKKLNEYKKRFRLKGKLVGKSITKKGNMSFRIKRQEEVHSITVLKSHKETYALAQKIPIGRYVSVIGIVRLRVIICTKLKVLDKGVDESMQTKLINS